MRVLDYENIPWGEYLIYDESSESGLRWLKRKGRALPMDLAGSKIFSDKSKLKPKCWDIRFNDILYKCHTIVWLLCNNNLDDNCIINHIDNNPFNNRIENLELVSQLTNCRRASYHTGTKLLNSNVTGYNGVAEVRTDCGTLRGYSAQVRNLNGEVETFHFGTERYGEELALILAVASRNYQIKKLNENGAGYATNIF